MTTTKKTRTLKVVTWDDALRCGIVRIATKDKAADYFVSRSGEANGLPVYIVNEVELPLDTAYRAIPAVGVCSCLGNAYRGKCKHVDALNKLVELGVVK